MSTPFKWFVISATVGVVVFFIAYRGLVQNSATTTTSEIEVLAESVSAGIIRGEVEEGGDGFLHFDKEELVANLVANVSTAQKTLGFDVKLDYVFLDNQGNVTEDDNLIRGIQFRVQYVDDKGEVKATAERRLALNYPSN
ncbi:hypothetical protein D5F11_009085 [Siminovitchia terrae]|uniref:Uncharacterized protein n=1 Tax=Siminovitchia terrae TaxID=1914933 RepID=A0A429XA25_SIMTE|nr:hypothetical protein [Siminovitchia terrae]RST60201.1 hypothetical protein D5F11_009085 [Siminovitchia terrae]